VFLSPSTTDTFRVRARDTAGNLSDLSDPIVVTTPAADPKDHEPPIDAAGLLGRGDGRRHGGDGLLWKFHGQRDRAWAYPVLPVRERPVRTARPSTLPRTSSACTWRSASWTRSMSTPSRRQEIAPPPRPWRSTWELL